MQSDFVIRAVEDAIKAHGSPEVMNSDQESQFTSMAYINCIKSKETIRISMNGKGRQLDPTTPITRVCFSWSRLL